MASTTSTKLGDDFLRIPKLEVTGTNWVIYKDRFTWAVDARGLAEHIEPNAEAPVDPLAALRPTDGTVLVLTAAQTVLDKRTRDLGSDTLIIKRKGPSLPPNAESTSFCSSCAHSDLYTQKDLWNSFQCMWDTTSTLHGLFNEEFETRGVVWRFLPYSS
ncbi:hypothetical protein B0H16DRAFT_1335375 [Mycena metata]|uniref:Uncharacterized protein n=1 Tax=Mycena metata TaxID=1033252 RepID=A0AAD7MKI9_9AGAR|nr:hypothetical protein B0H16DRAFT_1335375 [Mycena metata]